ARTRVSLVARGVGDIAKVDAPRALQYIAAKARHVADLLARRELERLRDHWIVAANRGMFGRVRHAGQGAEATPAASCVETGKNRCEERVDAADLLGPHHSEFHEVEEGRAAREILNRPLQCGSRPGPRHGFHRGLRRVHALVNEWTHRCSPFTAVSSTS